MKHGYRIATLRDKQGWTQEELAKRLGISRAALSHYEKNRREPDYETLTKLADLFHVSIDFLVGRTNNPHSRLDDDIRNFADQLELSDEDIMSRFTLTVDGKQLSPAEAKRFIAFVRADRMVNS